jgi:hypothetical protein
MEAFDHEHERTFDYRSPDHVPIDHPLHRIKSLADHALKELSRDFNRMYSKGWPPIPPGKLIRALLLQVLYSIRSERLLIEQLDYNLLFRWFVGLAIDGAVGPVNVLGSSRETVEREHCVEVLLQDSLASGRAGALIRRAIQGG